MDSIDADAPEEVEARSWPVTIRLRIPIAYGSERITSLSLRRGRVGDIKGIRLGNEVSTESLILIAARLSGQPTTVIERLDQDDAGEVLELAADFFGRCLSTGRKRLPSSP